MPPTRRAALFALSIAVLLPASLVFEGGAGTVASAATVPARSSPGCRIAAPEGPGTGIQIFSIKGDPGAYYQDVPPRYTGRKPFPLVVDLHGYDDTALEEVDLTGLGGYGESHNFITVTPQVAGKVIVWNTKLGSKDLSYIGAMVSHLEAGLCVDENRVFVTGISDGAFMTSSVACQFSNIFAAAAPVAGIRNPPGCNPKRPIPLLAIHGTADGFVAYTGGLGAQAQSLPDLNGGPKTPAVIKYAISATGPSIPAITAAWAQRDGCAATPTTTKVASDVTLYAYTCPSGLAVELYAVTGGGHAWPGSHFSSELAPDLGKTTFSISADQLIWNFFKSHPL